MCSGGNLALGKNEAVSRGTLAGSRGPRKEGLETERTAGPGLCLQLYLAGAAAASSFLSLNFPTRETERQPRPPPPPSPTGFEDRNSRPSRRVHIPFLRKKRATQRCSKHQTMGGGAGRRRRNRDKSEHFETVDFPDSFSTSFSSQSRVFLLSIML